MSNYIGYSITKGTRAPVAADKMCRGFGCEDATRRRRRKEEEMEEEEMQEEVVVVVGAVPGAEPERRPGAEAICSARSAGATAPTRSTDPECA